MTYWRASRREAPALGALNSSMLPGSTRAVTPRDSIPLPAGSVITPDHPLKSLNVTQALLNVAGVLNAIFVVLVTTAAFVIGPLLLFFVDLR